jgi:short-subunit dehydrogenase
MPKPLNQYRRIAITGASSGLGRALAIAFADPGATLHLTGRDAPRLAEVAATCRKLGAMVVETIADVTDRAAMEAWIGQAGPLDLVIANAGISVGPGSANAESPQAIRAVLATNLDGALNTALPAITAMAKQPLGPNGNRGRVAFVGSIAGLIALPTSPTYSAAKAALDFWVSATAPNLARDGVALTLVRPGFIRTPLTARNPYKMPGIIDADQAAAKITAGLAAGKTHITFPYWFSVFARIGNLMPKSMFNNVKKKPAST